MRRPRDQDAVVHVKRNRTDAVELDRLVERLDVGDVQRGIDDTDKFPLRVADASREKEGPLVVDAIEYGHADMQVGARPVSWSSEIVPILHGKPRRGMAQRRACDPAVGINNEHRPELRHHLDTGTQHGMNREFVNEDTQPLGLRQPVEGYIKRQIDALQRPRGLLGNDMAEADGFAFGMPQFLDAQLPEQKNRHHHNRGHHDGSEGHNKTAGAEQ